VTEKSAELQCNAMQNVNAMLCHTAQNRWAVKENINASAERKAGYQKRNINNNNNNRTTTVFPS
jgi:hypothetical protein